MNSFLHISGNLSSQFEFFNEIVRTTKNKTQNLKNHFIIMFIFKMITNFEIQNINIA